MFNKDLDTPLSLLDIFTVTSLDKRHLGKHTRFQNSKFGKMRKENCDQFWFVRNDISDLIRYEGTFI